MYRAFCIIYYLDQQMHNIYVYHQKYKPNFTDHHFIDTS